MIQTDKVAHFFIQRANEQEDNLITNSKLNKLMYYAQGIFLARTGECLFDEAIQAWSCGPIVPSVYRTYRVCGKNPIPFDEEDAVTALDFYEEELGTLLDVEREIGQYTGNALFHMLCKPDTPWSVEYNRGHIVISPELIRAYFVANPIPKSQCTNQTEQVPVLPKGWYAPQEDAEWLRNL